MVQPTVIVPANAELIQDPSNGSGYWYLRMNGTDAARELDLSATAPPQLLETADILLAAQHAGSVLVEGAPGSGKSHLVRDVQTMCADLGVTILCITTHVNGGKKDGMERIHPVIEDFLDQDGPKVLVTDNIDYLGYRGSSRTRSVAAAYASSALSGLQELLADPRVITIGTAHDDDWRAHRWTWQDPSIDQPALEALALFRADFVFEGRMTVTSIARLLQARGLERYESVTFAQQLAMKGLGDFFHAQHLDVAHFRADPAAAIEAVHVGRQSRIDPNFSQHHAH